MPIAKKATKYDSFLKVMAWGDSGSGKTRLALSFPDPLVADFERGTRLYADQFDFWVAEPTTLIPGLAMVNAMVEEIKKGQYLDRKTLIIDPITDYLEQIEVDIIGMYEKKGVKIDEVNALKKSQIYHHINRVVRERLEDLLRLPMHVVFVARAKKDFESKTMTYNCKDIVEYLCDIVIQLQKNSPATVKKSRIRELPATIRAITYQDIQKAFEADNKPTPDSKTAQPASTETKAAPTPPKPSATLVSDPNNPSHKTLCITEAQSERLNAEIKRLFGKTRGDAERAKAWISQQLGREIVASKEITSPEAMELIRKMESTDTIAA